MAPFAVSASEPRQPCTPLFCLPSAGFSGTSALSVGSGTVGGPLDVPPEGVGSDGVDGGGLSAGGSEDGASLDGWSDGLADSDGCPLGLGEVEDGGGVTAAPMSVSRSKVLLPPITWNV